jgi:hypothetical protein
MRARSRGREAVEADAGPSKIVRLIDEPSFFDLSLSLSLFVSLDFNQIEAQLFTAHNSI